MKLFEIVTQYRELQAIDPETIDEQTFLDTLAGLQGDLEVKAKNVAAFIANTEAFAEAVKDASDKMARRAEILYKRAENTRAYLKNQMEGAGITKIQSPEFVISIKKNPPSVTILEGAFIPDKYWVQPETPPKRIDKQLLKTALQNKEQIKGCSLDQGTRIDIKI